MITVVSAIATCIWGPENSKVFAKSTAMYMYMLYWYSEVFSQGPAWRRLLPPLLHGCRRALWRPPFQATAQIAPINVDAAGGGHHGVDDWRCGLVKPLVTGKRLGKRKRYIHNTKLKLSRENNWKEKTRKKGKKKRYVYNNKNCHMKATGEVKEIHTQYKNCHVKTTGERKREHNGERERERERESHTINVCMKTSNS